MAESPQMILPKIVQMSRNRCASSFFNFWRFCSQNLLLALTILSVIVDLNVGALLRHVEIGDELTQFINFPGEIFLRTLKMLILPLIFSSLIAAIAQLDAKSAAQMGLLALGYYAVTCVFAIITGISLVLLIQPGTLTTPTNSSTTIVQRTPISPLDTFEDVIRNLFPENVFQATFQRTQTSYHVQTMLSTDENTQSMVEKQVSYVDGTNILGVILFSICFGIVISSFGERAKPVVDLFLVLEAAIMKLVEIFMWLAPIGIVSLIAGNMAELDDLSSRFTLLVKYMCTIFIGLGIHSFITLPILYVFLTRKNPVAICKGMTQAIATTFGTSSGGATLPISFQCMEDKLKVDRRITRFVLPLGSTINMDGNALYEAVAVVFVAQLNGIQLSMAEVITVSLIATISSLGLNSVPAGLVSILLILNTIGLPTKDVAMLLTVDWLIDRVRSALNVLGDGFAASVVEHRLRHKLKAMDKKMDFHREIREEIEQLKSPTASFKPSTYHPMRPRSFSIDIVPCKNPTVFVDFKGGDDIILPISQV